MDQEWSMTLGKLKKYTTTWKSEDWQQMGTPRERARRRRKIMNRRQAFHLAWFQSCLLSALWYPCLEKVSGIIWVVIQMKKEATWVYSQCMKCWECKLEGSKSWVGYFVRFSGQGIVSCRYFLWHVSKLQNLWTWTSSSFWPLKSCSSKTLFRCE